jgi:hypothetical protein
MQAFENDYRIQGAPMELVLTMILFSINRLSLWDASNFMVYKGYYDFDNAP